MTRAPLVVGGLLLFAALVRGRARAAVATPGPPRPPPRPARTADQRDQIVQQISDEAARQGVPTWVALAFADLESGLNPNAFGDRDWPQRRPDQWAALRSRMPHNPAINDPAVWGSYGLFGLLAAYNVRPDEHPHVLWDAATNITRGVAAVAAALAKANGDPAIARRLYAGCRADGSNCSAEKLATVDGRFAAAARRWIAATRFSS